MINLLVIVPYARDIKPAKENFQSLGSTLRPVFYAAGGSNIRDLAGLQFSAVIGMEHLENAYDRAFVQLRLRSPQKEAT